MDDLDRLPNLSPIDEPDIPPMPGAFADRHA